MYSGSADFASSTTALALNQTVTTTAAATTTVLASSLNPSAPGQAATFTATVSAVSPATGTPTGTVTFNDGTTMLGTAILSGGRATFSTSTLSTGTHSITAAYSGDTNFGGSTSLVLVQTVQSSGSLNQNYVTQLYADLLRRQPDPGGLGFWTGLLNQNQATQMQVATGFVTSPEFRMLQVRDVYQKFLHRGVDPISLTGWTQYLVQGHTLEQLQAQIVASPEYFQTRAGGNTNNFLPVLIMDTYNRPLNQADISRFGNDTDDFDTIEGRHKVAEQVFATNEYRQGVVQSTFQRYLHRNADPVGLNASVAALKNGVSDEMLIAVVVSSPEYLSRVPLVLVPI
jgi:hypothetical protein